MCCRFTITSDQKDLERRFSALFDHVFQKRYNASPGQKLPVILNKNPKKITKYFWGLHPVWIEQVKKLGGILNVRDDNLQTKRTFASDLMNRRCLVITDGFYEWKKVSKGKQPYRIVLKNQEPFAFAGIWEENEIKGKKMKTFAIITTSPNSLMKKIHNRMPVILNQKQEQEWLEETNKNKLLKLLDPFPASQMKAYKVDKLVNSPSMDTPELIQPLENKQKN